LLAGLAVVHETDLAQDPEVLRGTGLGHAQLARHLGDRTLAASQQHEDLAPLRFGDRVEDVGGGRGACHRPIIYRYGNASTELPTSCRAAASRDRVLAMNRGEVWRSKGDWFSWRPSDADAVQIFHVEVGDPAAPPLVLVHGFPTSSVDWFEIADLLSDR